MSKKLSIEEAQAVIDGFADGWTKVCSEITGVGRWSVHTLAVYEFGGKFYQFDYQEAATENQDEMPFEYAKEPIVVPEVVPVEKTITVYEKSEVHDG